MKIESKSTATITTVTYKLLTVIGPVTYIEYLNDKGKVIDEVLRDEDGNNIDDATLLAEIQEFIDSEDEQQRRDEKHGLYGDKVDDAN